MTRNKGNNHAANQVVLVKRRVVNIPARVNEIPYWMQPVQKITQEILDNKNEYFLKQNQKIAKYGMSITDEFKLTTVDKL